MIQRSGRRPLRKKRIFNDNYMVIGQCETVLAYFLSVNWDTMPLYWERQRRSPYGIGLFPCKTLKHNSLLMPIGQNQSSDRSFCPIKVVLPERVGLGAKSTTLAISARRTIYGTVAGSRVDCVLANARPSESRIWLMVEVRRGQQIHNFMIFAKTKHQRPSFRYMISKLPPSFH